MSTKYALIQGEINSGKVKIESAFELARIERRRIKEGQPFGVDLNTLKCGRFGLTARESMFAYLVACSESNSKESPMGFKVRRSQGKRFFATSPHDIAIQCGFDADEADRLMGDRGVKQAIKEYGLQRLRLDGNPAEDLRNIALSRLASSASANVDSIVEYQSDRSAATLLEDGEVPEGNYYGYIPMAGGSMVRIKQMTELPDHVALAIKSFKIRNEGTKEYPVLVPDIEFHDGIRAAELLLKYTGDIGNKNNGEDVASAVRDIVGMIDTARRRNNERKPKELEDVNAIDIEFSSGQEVNDNEQEDANKEVEVHGDEVQGVPTSGSDTD